ncbi:hypothetical protein PI124_g18830 [Phytophthora idaei]|nr:hypothetical protein PI125_g19555 [Phytophthora idaei]KAG3135925.1 hypothetical protein PI126_g18038 [Phytophthora idaei]KAG3236154.1 hypothetical protein PI124_g18830 [Phytophthora idaei]
MEFGGMPVRANRGQQNRANAANHDQQRQGIQIRVMAASQSSKSGPDKPFRLHKRMWVSLFARDALLFGHLREMAKKLCKFTHLNDMWTAFERDKTKRDFANSIRIRAKLYGARFEKGKHMDMYLGYLEDFRRQLDNMNDSISDADMASIVLTGVERPHRNDVRMFIRDDKPPNLERVLNTLRGEIQMNLADAEMNGESKKK